MISASDSLRNFKVANSTFLTFHKYENMSHNIHFLASFFKLQECDYEIFVRYTLIYVRNLLLKWPRQTLVLYAIIKKTYRFCSETGFTYLVFSKYWVQSLCCKTCTILHRSCVVLISEFRVITTLYAWVEIVIQTITKNQMSYELEHSSL